MTRPILKVWTFRSDSAPNVQYETLLYQDGTTSCGCKGWTRRVAADGTRSCKHTRWIDQGIADRHCLASHDYQNHQPPTPIQNHVQIKTTPKLGQRKFAV
jgi:hypothetical protein